LPNRSPDEARAFGRYLLENDERVDVLVARAMPTVDGERVYFEQIWERRQAVDVGDGVFVQLPALDDLIRTKRFASRARDRDHIRLLETLRTKKERG
jgi:hypothetical protein